MHFEKLVKQKEETVLTENRSSHQRPLMKKGVLKNFTKFTGKHLCQNTFYLKETLAEVFSCSFCELTKNNQKQSPEVFFEKRCSLKFHKIHRKTPVPESACFKTDVVFIRNVNMIFVCFYNFHFNNKKQ